MKLEAQAAGLPGFRPLPARAVRESRPRIDAGFLGLVLLATTLFPRLLTALGAPAVLNFAHFAAAALFLTLALPEMRSWIAKQLLLGLAALFLVMCCSALLNGAAVINVMLDFLLLSEPFVFLMLLVAEPMSAAKLRRFRQATLLFAAIHVGFAHYQHIVQGRIDDDVKGVFLGQGAGHHVGGGVALSAAVYLLCDEQIPAIVARVALAVACALVALFADAKQVVAVFIAALPVYSLLRIRNPRNAALSLLGVFVALSVLWLARNVYPLLPMLMEGWRIRGGLNQKLSIVPLLVSHFGSGGQWLFGLGPGHTVGRLAHMLPDYAAYLDPLGATTSPVTSAAIALRESSEFSMARGGSSVWSPLFFWVGIWGDLGLVGVASYLWLWLRVWRDVCISDLSRFLVVTIFMLGAVFAWLEEPGYMLFVAAILGIEWQTRRRRDAARGLADPERSCP